MDNGEDLVLIELDFWDELNTEDQAAIDEGLEQLGKGQYLSRESDPKDFKG